MGCKLRNYAERASIRGEVIKQIFWEQRQYSAFVVLTACDGEVEVTKNR